MVITFTGIRKFDICCAYKCHQSKPSSLDNCSTDSWSNELPIPKKCVQCMSNSLRCCTV